MSSDETQSALSRAYELVEAGQYGEARAILDPILAANPNHADAWWVYAHAVTTPEDGRVALENVVRIDPRYPGAADLLAQALELSPGAAKTPSSPVPPPPGTIPEATHFDDFPEPYEEDAATPVQERPASSAEPKRSTMSLFVVIAAIAAVIVIGLLVLPGLLTPPAVQTPTPDAAVVSAPTENPAVSSTEAPTESIPVVGSTEGVLPVGESTDEVQSTRPPTITPTVEGVTAEAVASAADYPAISEALAAFPLAAAGITETQSTLGNTLVANVCSAPGREMRMLLPQVMNALASQSPSLPETVQAVGVSLVNCETNTPMLTVAAEMVSAQSFAQGDLSAADFAASWEPQ